MNFNENNNEKSLKMKNINNKIIITKKRINTNKFSNKFKNSSELMRTQLKERMLNEREKKRDNEKERNEETIRRLLLDDRNQILSSSRNNLIKESTNNETIENYLTSTKMPQINRQENNDYEEYRHYSAKERENNNKDKIEGIIENENYITRDEDYYTKIRRLFKNNEKNKEKKNENKGIVDERNAQRSRYLSRIKTINRKNKTTSIALVIGVFLAALIIFTTFIGLLTFIFIRNRRRNEIIAAENAEIFGDEISEWAPDHINATQFNYKGPLQIPFKQPLIMEHELENEKLASIHEEDHVAFDDALNEVYEIGSEVEKVIPGESKNVMIVSHEDKQKDMKNKTSNVNKESGMRKEIKGKKITNKKGSMKKETIYANFVIYMQILNRIINMESDRIRFDK
uniref:Uncharacterized protein n=1 Tax=Ascaris lumbricoides TaxID=6252 RepID=A0A0M3I5R2_ASCLU